MNDKEAHGQHVTGDAWNAPLFVVFLFICALKKRAVASQSLNDIFLSIFGTLGSEEE